MLSCSPVRVQGGQPTRCANRVNALGVFVIGESIGKVVNTPLHPREEEVFTTGSFGVRLGAHPVW